MKPFLAAALALACSPALADVTEVVEDQLLPGYAAFADAAQGLADSAQADCTPEALKPGYNTTFDAWMRVSHIQIGPVMDAGRAQAIAFWPDTRGATPATLRRLIADTDPVVQDPDGFAQVSVAARGLFALERMLFDQDFAGYDAGSYSCALTQAITTDLARMAGGIDTDWRQGYAQTLTTAGQPGNEVFLSTEEGARAIFTSLVASLEFTEAQRLGRPMGTFDNPRPRLAEAWRSGRSLRNVRLALEAAHETAGHLVEGGDTRRTDTAFADAQTAADAVESPSLADVTTPQGRLKVEALAQRVTLARRAVEMEIGGQLGVTTGFNAGDGD